MRHFTFSRLIAAATLLLAALFPAHSVAQNTSSPYSKFGYGLLRDNATSAQRQMGGVGYAMRSGRQINVMNPASYSAIDSLTFLFDMGIDYTNTQSKEGTLSNSLSGGGLDYITMQFPIGKFMGGSVGLVPYSSVGYLFGNDIENGSTQRQGDGGLNQLYLGFSGRLFKGFTVGANISYLFGTITHDVMTTPTGNTTALFEQVMEVRDYNLEFGVQYGFDINDDNTITLGAVYSPGKSLLGHAWVTKYDMTNDVENNKVLADTVIQRTSMKKHFSTPDTWGGGISYRWRNALTVEADLTYQPWGSAKFMDMENFSGSRFDDRYQVSVGAQYRHRERGNYLQRIQFRIGGFYNRDYIMVGDNNVRDYGLTCGFGLPAPMGKTLINLGFEWRRRQAYPTPLLKENRFAVTLGINFNELWFFQRKIN